MKKLTIEFVRGSFEREGYQLFSDKYTNAHQKLNYICPNGHKHSISWSNWNAGQKCPTCVYKIRSKERRKEFNIIEKSFVDKGCLLKTTEDRYKNAHSKLYYICTNGHEHSISWNSWQQGHGCSYCVGNTKLKIDFVERKFKKEGHKLLSREYKNSQTKLTYECDKGHKHSMIWAHWQQGKRCPTCFYINNSGENNHNWKGGISCEPYCSEWSFKEFKEMIRERDGRRCLNPDCWENCINLPLSIHHIDYNKKNCVPENLITVCKSCNSRAQKDQAWHKSWYQSILNKRYGYAI